MLRVDDAPLLRLDMLDSVAVFCAQLLDDDERSLGRLWRELVVLARRTILDALPLDERDLLSSLVVVELHPLRVVTVTLASKRSQASESAFWTLL